MEMFHIRARSVPIIAGHVPISPQADLDFSLLLEWHAIIPVIASDQELAQMR